MGAMPLLGWLLLAASLGGKPPVADSRTGVLSVFVVDERSNASPGVVVKVTGSECEGPIGPEVPPGIAAAPLGEGTSFSRSAKTNAKGVTTFRFLPPELCYSAAIEIAGYKKVEERDLALARARTTFVVLKLLPEDKPPRVLPIPPWPRTPPRPQPVSDAETEGTAAIPSAAPASRETTARGPGMGVLRVTVSDSVRKSPDGFDPFPGVVVSLSEEKCTGEERTTPAGITLRKPSGRATTPAPQRVLTTNAKGEVLFDSLSSETCYSVKIEMVGYTTVEVRGLVAKAGVIVSVPLSLMPATSMLIPPWPGEDPKPQWVSRP